MSSGQSSVFGLPSSAILFGVAVCSFIFYGVVGEDKTWLLAPAFIFSYTAITFALLKRAWRMARGARNFYNPVADDAFYDRLFTLVGL